MKTSSFSEELPVGHSMQTAHGSVPFAASALPVIGRFPGARAAAGVALTYAAEAEEGGDEDLFSLLIVDGDGDTLQRLGPFGEDEVVAVWRDLAIRAGLVRMILREDRVLTPVSQQIGRVMLGRVRVRRRAGLGARRPRFLARRKTGRLPARPQIFRGEHEIIARS